MGHPADLLAGMTVEDLAEAKQVFGVLQQMPRARWKTCATSPGASTRRCWPAWG
jgi:hypothetical protein